MNNQELFPYNLTTNDLRTKTVDCSIVSTIDSSTVEESTVSNFTLQSYDSNHSMSENTIEKVLNAAEQYCIDLLAQSNVTVTSVSK